MSTYITIPTILDLIESGSATEAEVLEAINVRATMKQAMREVDSRFDAALIAWIEANGAIESGDTRYYVGPQKDTKCNDQPATLAVLLELGGPDAAGKCLASGAFKLTPCRELLAEQFDAHFTTTEKPDLKTGKPVKKLHAVNERFLS